MPLPPGPRHAAFSSVLLPQLPPLLLSGTPVISYSPIHPSHSREVTLTHHKAGQMAHQKLFRWASPFTYRSRNFLAHEALLGPLQISAASFTALSLTLYTPATQAACGHPHRTHAHVHIHHPSHACPCARARTHTRSVLHSFCSLCLKYPPRFPHLPRPTPHLRTPTSPHIAWLAAKPSQHLRPGCPCFLGSFPEATSGIRRSVSI